MVKPAISAAMSIIRWPTLILKPCLVLVLCLLSLPTQASNLNGATLAVGWCLPFILVLLSIALCPLLIPHVWHQHAGKIMLTLSLIFLAIVSWQLGYTVSIHLVGHALLQEYLPFIILLTTLYTIAGGIHIDSNLIGHAGTNTIILAIGTLLAGFMGTTGAAMLMIRPLLKANIGRRHRTHIVIFFIILVGNIGGGLTPLGDPPLFLGFLQGVGFGWTLQHMLLPVAVNTVLLLIAFYLLDRHYVQQPNEITALPPVTLRWQLHGQLNLILLFIVIAVILLSATITIPGSWFIMGIQLSFNALIRDSLLVVCTLISLLTTQRTIRYNNQFNWQPMQEVAKLFIAIFITIAPVMAILQAGSAGALHHFTQWMHQEGQPNNLLYFWGSGLLSGFLDNAPTYLVFFNMAGGQASHLMQHLPQTLLAISMGSVFMGALSYIGNAPNLMIKSIAEQQQIKMPNFFTYIAYSAAILLPLFLIDSLLFLS